MSERTESGKPEISIIVPVYKTERFLSACISSILAQTFTDFELILVDDGSPDSCPALCDAAAAKDSRIRVIHQKNRGLSGARNAGLDAAEGEWIAFVDSDDTITPDFCAKLYHAAQEAGAQMAVCNYRQVDEALTPIREQYLHVRREVLTPEQALEHSTLLPYMVVWNKLYHRSIFAQLRVRADEDGLTPAFQTVAVGGIQQFIVFPGICRAHSVLPSLLSVSYWPRMRLLILSTMRLAHRSMASRSWPSTMTRIFGSVPETRTSTRPMSISFCCSFSMKPARTSSSL